MLLPRPSFGRPTFNENELSASMKFSTSRSPDQNPSSLHNKEHAMKKVSQLTLVEANLMLDLQITKKWFAGANLFLGGDR